jgi:hypothetical protein
MISLQLNSAEFSYREKWICVLEKHQLFNLLLPDHTSVTVTMVSWVYREGKGSKKQYITTLKLKDPSIRIRLSFSTLFIKSPAVVERKAILLAGFLNQQQMVLGDPASWLRLWVWLLACIQPHLHTWSINEDEKPCTQWTTWKHCCS